MVEKGEPKTEGATSRARHVSYSSSSIPVVKEPQRKHPAR